MCVQIGIVRRVCLVESVSLQRFNDTLEMYRVARVAPPLRIFRALPSV